MDEAGAKKPVDSWHRTRRWGGRVATGTAKLLAVAGGAGFSPVAPGTCGTLVAVPLAYWLASAGRGVLWLATLAAIGIGVWAADVAGESWHTEDDQRIVIDEVAGYLVTLSLVDARRPLLLGLAFVLFRVLDVWKPGPVRILDRRVHGGLGVMLDDVAAGVIGAIVLFALDHFGALRALHGLIWSRLG